MIEDDDAGFGFPEIRFPCFPEPRLYGADASTAAQMGSHASLDDDFHSPVDSDDKDDEEEVSEKFDDGVGSRDARTDTEDLAWMISIGV